MKNNYLRIGKYAIKGNEEYAIVFERRPNPLVARGTVVVEEFDNNNDRSTEPSAIKRAIAWAEANQPKGTPTNILKDALKDCVTEPEALGFRNIEFATKRLKAINQIAIEAIENADAL